MGRPPTSEARGARRLVKGARRLLWLLRKRRAGDDAGDAVGSRRHRPLGELTGDLRPPRRKEVADRKVRRLAKRDPLPRGTSPGRGCASLSLSRSLETKSFFEGRRQPGNFRLDLGLRSWPSLGERTLTPRLPRQRYRKRRGDICRRAKIIFDSLPATSFSPPRTPDAGEREQFYSTTSQHQN